MVCARRISGPIGRVPTVCRRGATLQNATKCYNSDAGAEGPAADEGRSEALPVLAALPSSPPSLIAALQPRQQDAIELLLLGRSDHAVAQAVKVHRVTVTKWRLYDPAFRAELNRRREQK